MASFVPCVWIMPVLWKFIQTENKLMMRSWTMKNPWLRIRKICCSSLVFNNDLIYNLMTYFGNNKSFPQVDTNQITYSNSNQCWVLWLIYFIILYILRQMWYLLFVSIITFLFDNWPYSKYYNFKIKQWYSNDHSNIATKFSNFKMIIGKEIIVLVEKKPT